MSEYVALDGKPNVSICYQQVLGSRGVFAGKIDGKDVAVKRVLPTDSSKREIEIMIRLPSHENTVRYFMSHETKAPPQWFIFMELCQKLNLYQLVKNNKNLNLVAKKTILLHVTFGLKHLHDNGVLHRDLKPQNILLSMDSRSIKVCDFGLSKITKSASTPVTKSESVLGTEGWFSPESCIGRLMSQKSDIYSLGLVYFYVMSNGKCPFEDTEEYRKKALDPSASLSPDWAALERGSEKYERILFMYLVKSMLERNPEDRPHASKVLAHPFFWKVKKKISFLFNLKALYASGDTLHPSSQLQNNWTVRLHLDDDEKQEFSSNIRLLPQVAADLESANIKQTSEQTLFSLMRRCVSDYKRKREAGKSIFSSQEEIWTFFFSKFPEVILKAYDSIYDLSESSSEGFADFKEPPTKKYLEPEPDPVSNLKCYFDGASIHLNWDSPPKYSATYVVATFVDGAEQDIHEITEQTFSVKQIKYSVSYTFVVNARNSQGMNGDTVQTEDIITPPDAPRNMAISQDDSKIFLSWAEPMDDYRVTFCVQVKAFEPDSKIAKVEYEAEADGHEFKVDSPLASVKYCFKVYGKNPFGKDGKCCSSSIITGPSRIVNVKSIIIAETIEVTWERLGNDQLRYSCITYCDGRPCRETHDLDSEQMIFEDVVASREYYFEVWAKNLFGIEGIKTKSTIVYAPPEVLTNIEVEETKGQFVISWIESNSAYCVQVLCGDEKVGDVQIINESTYVFASPEQNKSYWFEVWARNSRGVNGKRIKVGPYTLGPTPVRDVSVERKDNGVIVRWEAGDHEDMKHLYLIQLYCDGSISGEKISTFSLMCFIPRLRLLKTSFVRVWVEVEGKKSEYTQSQNIFMSHEEKELRGLQVTISPNGIHLWWEKTVGDIEHYRVRIIPTEENAAQKTVIAKENIYDFLDCSPSQEYRFEVESVDQDGVCHEKGTTSPQTAPPSKVKNVIITKTRDVFHLRWDPQEFASKYEIESFCSGKSEHTETAVIPRFWYHGDHAKRYFFKITAINHKGLRGPTLRTETTTIAPAKLSGVKAVYKQAAGANYIRLFWNPAAEQVIYHVKILTDKDLTAELHDTEEMEYILEDPRPSTKYTFHIWARNLSNVDGIESEVVRCTPPSMPHEPTVQVQDGKMEVSWEWPYEEDIERFEIRTMRKEKLLYVSSTKDLKVKVDWVAPSKEYRFGIIAIKNNVKSNVAITKSAVSPPSKIQKLKCVLENRTIRVKWASAANENVVRYYYETFCEEVQTGRSLPVEICRLEIPTEFSKSYYVEVWAENDAGVCGPKSRSSLICTPPGPVRSLQISTSDTHVQVSWSPSSDGDITYLVQEYCNDRAVGRPHETVECSYSTEAKPLTKYNFIIWARNQYLREGQKSRSSTINTAATIQIFDEEQTTLLTRRPRKKLSFIRRILPACCSTRSVRSGRGRYTARDVPLHIMSFRQEPSASDSTLLHPVEPRLLIK